MSRPQSASAHQKVLKAALELVSTRGVDGTSMDAIAAKSGVSKATIYKHWADKDALLMEMLADLNGLHTRPKFDSGRTRDDIVAVLAYRPRDNSEMRERIMPQFLAYSSTNVSFGNAWRNMVMEPPRRELRHLLRLGIEKHELSRDVDVEIALVLLLGPLLYWHAFMRKTSEGPERLAQAVVDAFWRAFSVRRPPRVTTVVVSQRTAKGDMLRTPYGAQEEKPEESPIQKIRSSASRR